MIPQTGVMEIARSSSTEKKPPIDISLSLLRKQFKNKNFPMVLTDKILAPRKDLVEDIFELQHPRSREEGILQQFKINLLTKHSLNHENENNAFFQQSYDKKHWPLFEALLNTNNPDELPSLEKRYQILFSLANSSVNEESQHQLPRIVGLLKTPGMDINFQDDYYRQTVLHKAAKKGNTALVQALIELPGIDVNVQDSWKKTPLFIAVEEENLASVRALLQKLGIDVNLQNFYGNKTPLHQAIEKGNLPMVEELLQMPGIQVSPEAAQGVTPLHLAARAGNPAVALALLQMPGTNVNQQTAQKKWTPLHVAVEKGDVAMVKTLLQTPGIQVNLQDENGYTPLHLAVIKGDTAMASPPLHVAIEQGSNAAMVQILLQTPGVDINRQDKLGNTPLHLAITTALHSGVTAEKLATLEALLKAPGINTNLKNVDNRTPLQLAKYSRQKKLVQLVRKYIALQNTQRKFCF